MKNIPDVVTVKKASEILGCCKSDFYKKHFHNLKSFKDRNNYRTLFFLKDVEEYAKKTFGEQQYNIVG